MKKEPFVIRVLLEKQAKCGVISTFGRDILNPVEMLFRRIMESRGTLNFSAMLKRVSPRCYDIYLASGEGVWVLPHPGTKILCQRKIVYGGGI